MNLRCAFVDFWPGWNSSDNWILDCINSCVDVADGFKAAVVCGVYDSPHVIFCSSFGSLRLRVMRYAQTNGIPMIYFTGENDWPNLDFFDYSVSMKPYSLSDRNLYLPLFLPHSMAFDNYTVVGSPDSAAKHGSPCERGFCSAVVSNVNLSDPRRFAVWDAVASYKGVASGGRHANNVGAPVGDKQKFIACYKFNLALENSSVEGYVTEKITDALFAGTVPIYWGAPDVSKWINPESFIDVGSFPSLDDAVQYIKEVDCDDGLYMKYLKANPFSVHNWSGWKRMFTEHVIRWVRQGTACPAHGRVALFRHLACKDTSELDNHPVGDHSVESKLKYVCL